MTNRKGLTIVEAIVAILIGCVSTLLVRTALNIRATLEQQKVEAIEDVKSPLPKPVDVRIYFDLQTIIHGDHWYVMMRNHHFIHSPECPCHTLELEKE